MGWQIKFFVVAWEEGGMFMFLNITSTVEIIKIGNKMKTAKTLIKTWQNLFQFYGL